MILKQLGRLLTAVILSALPLSATVQVSAHLTDPSGAPASIAYVRFELSNCGFNVPAVPSQPLSVVWKHIDLKPNKTTGIATGTIFGNDEIRCGGSESSLWHVTAFSDANTPIAGDKDYLIEASLGAWEFSAANPFTGNRPPPGFQSIFANPVANQRIVQPSGTSLAITGTFDLTNATVIGFTGGTPGSGIGISVNSSNVNGTAANFNDAIPAPIFGAVNVTWQRDALNPANVSGYIPGATNTSVGLIKLGGDLCTTSIATAPRVCSLSLPAALSIAQGGTGQASAAAAFNALAPSGVLGTLIVGTGTNTYGALAPPSGTKILTAVGSTISWQPSAAGSITAGTTNLLPKYTDGANSILGNSSIQDTGTNVVIATEPAQVLNLNGVLHASQFSGSDASAKIQAAIVSASCPAAGCVIDARDLTDVAGAGSTSIDPGTKTITLYLGPTTYFISQILLRNSFHIYGMGSGGLGQQTILQSCATCTTTDMFVLGGTSPVTGVHLKGFRIYGSGGLVATGTNQSAFSIVASASGGLWQSVFEDLVIGGFKGNGGTHGVIRLDGSAGGSPPGITQFDSIRNVTAYRTTGGGPALEVTGFAGQLSVFDSYFDSQPTDTTGNVVLLQDSASQLFPFNATFYNVTIQGGAVAVDVKGCNMCSFYQGHFEKSLGGFLVETSVSGLTNTTINISNSQFNGNVGVNGGNGYLVRVTGPLANTAVNFGPGNNHGGEDAQFAGTVKAIASWRNFGGTSYSGSLFDSNSYIPTENIESLAITGTTQWLATTSLDAHAAATTIPWTTGTGAPDNANCTVTGQGYFQSDGTVGQEMWYCKSGTWSLQLNSGASGASTTLNNLGTTAINADLLPNGTRHLGAATTPWADIFIGSASGNTAQLTGTFTGNRVVTFPDSSFTVAGLGLTNTFTANNTFNANIQLGASGRVISGATGAPTSSCVFCFGSADRARYGTNSFNLIGVTSASSPVQVGDTPGISLLGPVTSVTNGQSLSIQPLVASTNAAGGSTTVSGGAGNGTGANGDLILGAGSGGASGTGFVQVNSGAAVPCVNSPAGTTSNGLVSYSATGCVDSPAGSTLSLAGVCVEGCGLTGTAKIVRMGSAPLTLDNTGVAGDYVCISGTNAHQGHDCGTAPNTQTVGVVQSLLSGAIYNVDVNVAGVSSTGATGAALLAPPASQTIQATSPTATGLIVKAPASAGNSQIVGQQVDNTGANLFNCTQANGCQFGSGVGGSAQLSHLIGPNSNPATTGIVEASSGDVIFAGRNNANNADLTATLNSSDILVWSSLFQSLGLITTTKPIIQTEIAAPSGTSGALVTYGNSSTHWPEFNPNNVGAFKFAPIPQLNTQSGTTYTVLVGDVGKLINFTSGSAIAVTLPQSIGVFGTNFCFYSNAGGVGTVTITPTTSTINGAANIALSSGQNAMTCADGSGNYIATISSAGGGSGDMIKNSANVMGASGTLNGGGMSVTAGLIFPKGAGANPTTDAVFAQDTTLHLPVFGNGTSTRIFGGTPINSQSGTSYTILTTDANKAIVFGNAAPVAVTLPQAGASFPNGWMAFVSNSAAGLVTITPTTSTIDGAASVTISNGQSFCIVSNGTNYFTQCKGAQSGLGDPGSNGFAARTAANVTSARTLTGTANQINVTNGTGASGNPVFSLDTTHVATDSNSLTLTNKTLDAEGTGNVITRPFYVEFTPSCNNATAGPGSFDVPTSAAATFTCFGTTTTQGAADLVDAATSGMSGHFTLPVGWTGNMDVRITWFANASSSNAVRWSVATGCVADTEAISTGPSYNTAATLNGGYVGTANQRKLALLSAVPVTNCASGETFYFTIQRIGGDAGDTLAATAEVISVQWEGRATQ